MVLEQFVYTWSPDVRGWILERKPKTARNAAELADDYADIHAPASRHGVIGEYRGHDPWKNHVHQRNWGGGVHPTVPLALVYLDWRAGKGLREVGVSKDIPVNVLLGNYLGRTLYHYAPEDTDCKLEGLSESPAQSKVLCETLGNVVKCDRWEGEQGMDKCLPVTESVMPSKDEVGCVVKCDYNEFQMPKPSGEGLGRGFAVPQVTIKDEGPGVSADLPVCKFCETVVSESKGEEEWDFPSVTYSLDGECREQRLCSQEESGRQGGMPIVAGVTCQQYARAAAIERE
ncbi:uncharacterized protein WCC33_000056 [Rhinophrynus dorsalis]